MRRKIYIDIERWYIRSNDIKIFTYIYMGSPISIPSKNIMNEDFVCSITLIDCNVDISEYVSYIVSVKMIYIRSGNGNLIKKHL